MIGHEEMFSWSTKWELGKISNKCPELLKNISIPQK